MSERESICADLVDEGLVAIVRVHHTKLALPLAKALVAGGIRDVELTSKMWIWWIRYARLDWGRGVIMIVVFY